jgi:prepilin-type N-terminal cleavage/methylation domain-containing protein
MIRRKGYAIPKNSSGFTLIEMIGVLAIIAILVAAISPRIFNAISDSKVTSFSTVVKTVQTATSKYYADIGSLLPLSPVGVPTVDATGTLLPGILIRTTAPATTGFWPKFRGPYLDKFANTNPPIGTTMIMPAVVAVAGVANAANVTNYDVNGDGTGDFPATCEVISLQLTGVSMSEFDKLDGILDDGIGATAAEKQARGKVKWQNAAGGTLRVFLANR